MHSNTYDWYMKAGDTEPQIEASLTDHEGNILDLTDYRVVFRMANSGTGETVVDALALILNAVAGEVAYAWADGDTDEAALYNGQFIAQHSSGREVSFPSDDTFITVLISPKLPQLNVMPAVRDGAGIAEATGVA